jgi:hypothetical protein
MIIQKDKVEWVLLRSATVSNTNFSIVLKPDPVNDSIYQKCKITSTGYEAIYYRNKYASSYHDLREQMFGINAIPGDTINAVNIDLPEQPFELDFHRQTVLENLEDKIIISPFCDLTITENPLKQPVRNLPLDFIFKKSKKMESVILIPNGYKLLSKPEDMKIDNALVEINFTTNIQNDGSIKIVGEYSFKKEIYPVIDYFDLKRAFNKIIDKFNEKLVLVKV